MVFTGPSRGMANRECAPGQNVAQRRSTTSSTASLDHILQHAQSASRYVQIEGANRSADRCVASDWSDSNKLDFTSQVEKHAGPPHGDVAWGL